MKCLAALIFATIFISNCYCNEVSAIVGDITSRDVRIVYWRYVNVNSSLIEASSSLFCSISLFPPVSSNTFLMVEVTETPKVLELVKLPSNTDITAKFHCSTEASEPSSVLQTVQFRTQSEDIPSESNYTGEIFFLSCNRQADEIDEEMWNKFEQVTNEITENRKNSKKISKGSLIYHMGDQIYADQVKHIVKDKIKEKNDICITYHDVLLEYRKIYTKTWNSTILQTILSKYSNIMLLDDHDIINNLNELKWKNKTDSLQIANIRAGIQTFLEYQHQLISDIPSFDFVRTSKEASCCLSFDNDNIDSTLNYCNLDNKWEEFDNKIESIRFWNKKIIGNVGILTVDTRGDQTFSKNSNSLQLFSDEQLHFVKETLHDWNNNDNIHTILIVSSIPIIYQSSFMAEIAFIAEGERYSTHKDLIGNTGDFLDILFSNPKKISIVSGDIHMYLNSEICRSSDNICIPQLISSGMHKKSSTIRSLHLYLYAFFAIHVFTPYVYSSNNEYYLKFSQVFLDNSFIQYSYNHVRGSWILFKRDITDIYLNVLESLFENPTVIYFFVLCIISNILAVFCAFILIRYKQKNANNKLKKE